MLRHFFPQKISSDRATINEILSRGVEDVFVRESLEKKLITGGKLRVKLGFDPTGSKIHLGRAAILWKLRAFQDLGHTVVFIVGDFTAQIGDPSDKLEKRPMLTPLQIKKNLETYKNQVGKIIDLSRAEFHFNSRWLKKLGFQKISELAECFSVQQMSARRNFKERLEKGIEVSLREFLYPLTQGYDSVVVSADVEIGGFDQLFNLKAGRIIQKHYSQAEQDILTIQMLLGTDGRKMSTSWGNVINITDTPDDMYGKVMSLKDNLMAQYFLLCTKVSLRDIESIKKELVAGINPRDIKMRLAREIVSVYYDIETARRAEENFIKTFSGGRIPETAEEMKISAGESLSEIFLRAGVVKSKTELRRLVEAGAVHDMDTGEKISDPAYSVNKTAVFKIGKHRFLRVVAR